jgi:hypothetical protein
MNKKAHNERCRECKQTFRDLLAEVFSSVESNYDLNIPCRLEAFNGTEFAGDLEQIYDELKQYRGFEHFVKATKLPRVDYFIPSRGLIIEYDESQHFTKPREITFSHYPDNLTVGFPVDKWKSLCQKLNKKDNDPPYRDEQRAWYDAVRDFAPQVLGAVKTIRLYSRDEIWCSLNPKNETDLLRFKNFITEGGTQ